MNKEQTLWCWLRPAIWAAVIFTLSTDTFSGHHTGGIILAALHWLMPHASASRLDLIHLLIRKSTHIVEYFIFSWLLFEAVRGGQSGWKLRWAILALAIAATYGGLDEFHQSFVPSRTASPRDVLLDTIGAAAAQIAAWSTIKFQHETDADIGTSPKTRSKGMR